MEEEKRRLAESARAEARRSIFFLILVGMITTLVAFLSLHDQQGALIGTVITTWGVTINQCRQHFTGVRDRMEVKGEVVCTRHELRNDLNNLGLAQKNRDADVADTLVQTNLTRSSEPFSPEMTAQLKQIFTEISVSTCEAIVKAVVEKALVEYHTRYHKEEEGK